MKVDIWMPVYIGDYIADTLDLNAEEHGVYFLLLIHYWKKGALPDNIEKLLMATRLPEEKRDILENLLDTYFQHVDGHYVQKRVEEEMLKAKSRRDSAAENGRKGGRPKKPTENPTHNPQNTHGFIEGIPTENPWGNPQKSSSPSPSPSPLKKEKESGNPDNVDEKIPFKEIIDYLNEQCETHYRYATEASKKHIRARWNEGFRVPDFKTVIDNKTAQWFADENQYKYLRPETLFGTKFEGYLNE